MTFGKFTRIADAVNLVLRHGIDLIDRESKISAAISLVGGHLPEFSRVELKSALRQISAINQDTNLRPIQPPNGGTPPPGGKFPHEQEFRRFLKETRIMGEPTIDSYVSFINGASNDLGENVPRILLASTGAPGEIVTRLANRLLGKGCKSNTVNNRKVAIRAYLKMVAKYGLRAHPLDKSENSDGQKSGRISKTEARRRAQQCGIAVTSDMRFANITGSPRSLVWFLDIPSENLQREGDITLLLYDNRNSKLHCLQVPTSHFHENHHGLIEQMAQGRLKFRIRLSASKNDRFCDIMGKGKVSFAQFHHGKC